MILEIPTIISIIEQIRKWLDKEKEKSEAQKTEAKNALKAIYTASIETKAYLTKRETNKKRDKKIETGLAKLWAEAAIEARNIAPELAGQLEMKSNHWTEPQKWTDKQIVEAGIDINQITESARKLLLNDV